MIGVLRKIWRFAGEEQKNINKSLILGLFYAVFHMLQVGAIYFVVIALTNGETATQPAWTALALLLLSIAGRAAVNRFAQLQQTHAGYFMVANKRIAIGDKLKRVPMGYYNEKSIGEVTGVATTVLTELENTAPMVLVSILSGFINALVFTLMVLVFDWRIGLLVVAGTVLYLIISDNVQKKSAALAPKRQESEAMLTGAVLEQMQGMGVIKSFNLTGKGDNNVRSALEYNKKSNLDIEKMFTPYTMAQSMALNLFSVAMTAAAIYFWLGGSMSLPNALITVIMSFMVFAQIESAGSGLSIMRVVESSIDHANQTDLLPEMDSAGQTLAPQNHDIEMKDVTFSYGQKEILRNISLKIPSKTTTAVIGPSGSGKTTLCNLIARFWDVDSGTVSIGGRDVRGYTLESLMDQMAFVFQNVYLFADTVENNIKFGRPGATHEEVVEAAKKACCHDFITALPKGYDTVIGEGGGSLSGGEKQRISIARAMLKDAPIIILDEATANVDPENEDRLQTAIRELTHGKTIVMIAHRLKTVRHADQILVVDEGQIVQRGKHEELIGQPGIYADFVLGREQANSWRLQSAATL